MADYFIKNTFGDTAERSFLCERAMERGLYPYEATNAIVKASFMPITLDVPIGTRFSYGSESINYVVTSKEGNGIYFMTAESPGTAGNMPAGNLLPIDYVAGLSSAELVEVVVPGEDEEETEAFRKRYLASFDSQAFGGNIADYKEKVNKIQGVGGVKVYPVWNGGGTVRIAFMTSEFQPPTEEFVQKVQEIVDPIPYDGMGVGTAPIGHYVTVEGATNSAIDIGLNLVFGSGSWDDYKDKIEEAVDAYFLELNEKWESTQVAKTDHYANTGLVIRISQIESRLLDIEGIDDIENTTLNGVMGNLVLGVDELAIRGDVHAGG